MERIIQRIIRRTISSCLWSAVSAEAPAVAAHSPALPIRGKSEDRRRAGQSPALERIAQQGGSKRAKSFEASGQASLSCPPPLSPRLAHQLSSESLFWAVGLDGLEVADIHHHESAHSQLGQLSPPCSEQSFIAPRYLPHLCPLHHQVTPPSIQPIRPVMADQHSAVLRHKYGDHGTGVGCSIVQWTVPAISTPPTLC